MSHLGYTSLAPAIPLQSDRRNIFLIQEDTTESFEYLDGRSPSRPATSTRLRDVVAHLRCDRPKDEETKLSARCLEALQDRGSKAQFDIADMNNMDSKLPNGLSQSARLRSMGVDTVSDSAVPDVAQSSTNRAKRRVAHQMLQANDWLDDHTHSCTIIPQVDHGEHSFYSRWETMMLFMIFFVAIREPYVVAFYGSEIATEPKLEWEILSLIQDVAFTADMISNFFVAYPYSAEEKADSLWEQRTSMIARRYLGRPFSNRGVGGWFWIDLISVVPGWLHIFQFPIWAPFRVLRCIRILRIRQFRMLPKLLETWHSNLGFPFYAIEFVKFLTITTLACHWMACAWLGAEGKMLRERKEQVTWLSALIDAKGDSCSPDAQHDNFCVYMIALYWSMMTLTSVGYGDITPQNHREYFTTAVCMLISGFTWAFVVGSIVSLLSSLDPHQVAFRQRADDMNELVQGRNLPYELQVRLRTYIHGARDVMRLRDQNEFLSYSLSEGLQREIASCSSTVTDLRHGVWWAEDLEDDAIYDMIRKLRTHYYGPQEVIILRQRLLIVRDGLVAVKGRILCRGECHGAACILLETKQLLDTACPRSLSNCSLWSFEKDNLREICMNYPTVDRRLRRAQVRTAVWRAFIAIAQRMQTVKKFGIMKPKDESCPDYAEEVEEEDYVEENKKKMWTQSMVGRGSFCYSGEARFDVSLDDLQLPEEIAEEGLSRQQSPSTPKTQVKQSKDSSEAESSELRRSNQQTEIDLNKALSMGNIAGFADHSPDFRHRDGEDGGMSSIQYMTLEKKLERQERLISELVEKQNKAAEGLEQIYQAVKPKRATSFVTSAVSPSFSQRAKDRMSHFVSERA